MVVVMKKRRARLLHEAKAKEAARAEAARPIPVVQPDGSYTVAKNAQVP